jgi:hypothetical protein
MHNVVVDLGTVYDSRPCSIEIISNNQKIFEGEVIKDLKIEFDYPDHDSFELEIIKSGKTMDVAKSKHRQEIYIRSLLLNGCNLHPEKFGQFQLKDNPYVQDSLLQTEKLTLNGIWKINLPLYRILGVSTLSKNTFRDTLEDCGIACFGCSFTYGTSMKQQQTWPYLLGANLNKKVHNYGIAGSNNQEILANAEDYSKKFKCNSIILLLSHFCRLQINDAETEELINWHPKMELTSINNSIKNEIKKMILYSEDSILLAGQVPGLIEKISLIEKNIGYGTVYISSYIKEQYLLLSQIEYLKDRLLPLFNLDQDKPFASDGHHPGPLHYQQWADNITKILNK